MAQAFTGVGELVDHDIPSAAILQVAKDNLKTNRKTLLKLYENQTCPTMSSTMPDKAQFHKSLIEYTLGYNMEWVLRPPRSNHDDYKKFCTPGAGGSKKERAHQFVSEVFTVLRDILQTTSCQADLAHVTNGDFREPLEAFETDISYTPVEQIQAHKYLLNLPDGEKIFSRADGFINENEQIRTQDFVKRIKYANKIGNYAQYRRSDDDSKCPWHDSVITIDDVQKPDSGLKYPAFIRDDSNFLTLVQSKPSFIELFACLTSRASTRAAASSNSTSQINPFQTYASSARGGQGASTFAIRGGEKQEKAKKLENKHFSFNTRDNCLYGKKANDLYQCKTCQDRDPQNIKSKQEKSHLVYDPVHCPHYSTSGGNGKWTKVGGNSTKRKYSGSGSQTSKRSTTWQAEIECRNKPCHTEGCKYKHSTGKSTQRQQPTDIAMLAQIKTLTETVTALAAVVDKLNG